MTVTPGIYDALLAAAADHDKPLVNLFMRGGGTVCGDLTAIALATGVVQLETTAPLRRTTVELASIAAVEWQPAAKS